MSYDDEKWAGFSILLQGRGSVYSICVTNAIVASVITLGIRLLGYGPNYHSKQLTFAYGIVGFALGFSLVIRAGISYERFWEARDHLSRIQSRIIDMAMFTRSMSKRPDTMMMLGNTLQVHREFQEEMSRLFQVLVTVMIQRMQEDPLRMWDDPKEDVWDWEEYELSTIMTETEISLLKGAADRPQTVLGWIMDYTCATAAWNIPPPMKAMFFGYSQDVLSAYGDCMKIIDTTVPFPMIHIGMAILNIFYVSWPFLMAQLCKTVLWAMLMAFVPILAFFAVNAIALELQDPFGNDDNDLPLIELHACICREVRIILEPWNFDFGEADAAGSEGPIAADSPKRI